MYSLDVETCKQQVITHVCIEEEDWDAMENEMELKK